MNDKKIWELKKKILSGHHPTLIEIKELTVDELYEVRNFETKTLGGYIDGGKEIDDYLVATKK